MRQADRVTVIGECECSHSTETRQTCGQAWTRNHSRRHAQVCAFKSLQDGELNELHKVQHLGRGRVLTVDCACPPWSSNAKVITRQLPHVLLALLWGSPPKIPRRPNVLIPQHIFAGRRRAQVSSHAHRVPKAQMFPTRKTTPRIIYKADHRGSVPSMTLLFASPVSLLSSGRRVVPTVPPHMFACIR